MDLLEMSFKGAVGAVAAVVGWTVKTGVENKGDIRELKATSSATVTTLSELKTGQTATNEKLDRLIEHLLASKE